jgi:hypothetical protein
MAFPLGMNRAQQIRAELAPWLWGINGALSVVASVLSVIVALSAGISASYWTGVGCYAVAAVALAVAVRMESSVETADSLPDPAAARP